VSGEVKIAVDYTRRFIFVSGAGLNLIMVYHMLVEAYAKIKRDEYVEFPMQIVPGNMIVLHPKWHLIIGEFTDFMGRPMIVSDEGEPDDVLAP
jgi:hypothetical protein